MITEKEIQAIVQNSKDDFVSDFQPHKVLSDVLWDGDELRENLRNVLYKIAKELDPEDRTIRWRYKQAYDSLYRPVAVPDSNSTDNQTVYALP